MRISRQWAKQGGSAVARGQQRRQRQLLLEQQVELHLGQPFGKPAQQPQAVVGQV
ncbi:hypothetical protein [Chromobacterium vaccinii]|uniref:hypothetical protein n=1 Tax=Chromobacterium vaccinii TaxID=1108595 RepID=UPI001642B400|nr:hypothetical protein [Chromobacterium vaccinii]